MKRYFDIPSKKLVCELIIEKGTPAETAGIEVFRKYLKADDAVEVSKQKYLALSVKYGC